MPHLDRCLSPKFSPPTLPAAGRELTKHEMKRSARWRDKTTMAIQTQPHERRSSHAF
jgi:hypothetical protein